MGYRLASVFTNTFIGPLPANNTETILCTTPPINTPADNTQIVLLYSFSFIPGASTTFVQVNIRRGTALTGTSIFAGTQAGQVTAGTNAQIAGFYVDTPGAVGGQQYTLTVIQGAATAAGTFAQPALMAFVL